MPNPIGRKPIIVTDEVHAKLTALKQHPREPLGWVIDRLIDEHNTGINKK